MARQRTCPQFIAILPLICVAIISSLTSSALAVEHVTFLRDGVRRTVAGEAVVRAQDGGVLLRGADGTLWTLPADEIQEKSNDSTPFRLLQADEVADTLKKELGGDFKIHTTAHYVIAYNTSTAYARWCGALYERLFRAFQSYWKGKGIKLSEPDGPLVALVFDSRKTFVAYARRDLGVDPGGMIGYYNVRTNRVNMYDLTGIGASSTAKINQVLMQPQAERTVATIVHEATHQLAYNTGLQTRYADNPFWVSEGLAVFFETPDLRSTRGWRGIGAINQVNMTVFRRYLPSRTPGSLANILSDDSRFRDGKTSSAAYAEAWALNYYLLKRKHRQYTKYLAQLAERTPLIELTGPERLAEFTEAFGPIDELEADFLRFMSNLR